MTRLLLDGDTLSLEATLPDGQLKRLSGSITRVRTVLDRESLSAPQLETAIELTEDIIMPMLHALPVETVLEASGTQLADVLQLLVENHQNRASIHGVERLFNQLADHAAGSAIAWQQPIPAAHVALGLSILREVMFHGGLEVVCLPPERSSA